MSVILVVILFLLMFFIGGDRGIIAFLALIGNISILLLAIIMMNWGVNPIVVTFIGCSIIGLITIFYQNGKNAKTVAAFIAILIVIIILFFIVYKIGMDSKINGLNEIRKKQDDIMGLSLDINIDMLSLGIAVIIIGFIGSIMDTAMAISSSVYEVYKNNKHLSGKELFKSGINMGKDVLGTTINTLFFAFCAENMMLFILLNQFNYSLIKIINSKAFFQEFIYIIFSAIASVLIIPITAMSISYIISKPEKFKKLMSDDELFNDTIND